MDKQKIDKIHREMQEAVQKVAKSNGVAITMAGGKFDDISATIKFKVVELAEDGNVVDVKAEDFKKYARNFNLKPKMLGECFTTIVGKTYKVVGLKPSNHRYPVICEDTKGNRFKFKVETVVDELQRAVSITHLLK